MNEETQERLKNIEDLMRYNSKEIQNISKTTIIIQLLMATDMIIKIMKK